MNKHCSGRMHNYLVVILLSLFSLSTFGQGPAPVQGFYNTTNWRFSNPKQFGFGLIDLDFADNNRGIAVGANGGIAYTTDGGAKWSYGAFTFMSPAGILTSSSFQDVQFISATTAHAVGTNGCMAKTTDGGATWTFVRTPLYNNAKSINTVWFLDANKGYIAGQHNNTPDLTPKLYFTNDGGATWDSLAAPIGGKTRVGYPNNPNVAPLIWDITAKGKEIWRIIFVNNNLGYISGSGSGAFEPMPNVSSTTTCLPLATTTSTASHHASLLWKFSNGTLIDYSVSKERLGYNGIYNAAPTCTYRYASNSVHTQQYKAMHIVDDTTVLLISSNNNIVVKVSTGPNSFTPNINVPAVTEIGTYKLLNAPSPPTNNSNVLGAPIPASPVFSFLNPTNIVKATNGKLFTPVLSATFGPTNQMMTSIDTGKTWISERFLPAGQNYSNFGGQAVDILPSGKMVFGGTNGVTSEILPGGSPTSTYVQYGVGSWSKMDWADCNNGMAAGSGFITTTRDGGKTWNEMVRQDLININAQINSCAYVPNNPAKAYFATSVGLIFKSNDINNVPPAPAATLDPVLALNTEQMMDVATAGNDSVWVCGQSGFSVAAASRSPKIFRSTNGGTSWTTYNGFNVGTLSQTFRNIEFPSRLVGYVSGSRDTVWKTTDGGVTWNKLPVPTPGVTPQISYTDMFALDANTVFLVGNGFPRKTVFKTTDGGATWQDITSNILAIMPVSNLNSIVFHDANNGYVGANGAILVTNDGGATWRLDVQPSNTNNVSIGFASKKVPAGTLITSRRLFTVGVFGNHIMEYGDTTKLNVSSNEGLTASCNNVANGGIVITATGGITPYTYSLDGGTFQTSNTFINVAAGNHTITIRDAACGILTKTVTVGVKLAPPVNAGPDFTIVDGDQVTLQGSSTGTPASIAWTPNATLTGANTLTPIAKPRITTPYLFTVQDINGCISTDNAVVTVIPYCIKVMNAFTPNGDGMNDRWLVTNGAACTKQIAVAVYNRYGNIIYKNDNYQNNWDGTYNGKPVADGTYYYSVTYTTITSNTIFLRGDVTILR